MSAKLIKVEKDSKGITYLDRYYFECVECGTEYIRHRNDSRISPFCGECQRKHDYEREKERIKARKKREIIAELEKLKSEFAEKEGVFTSYHFVKAIDEHIVKLKGSDEK